MNDIEICKRIAEIDGYARVRATRVTIQVSSEIYGDDFELYNPLTDDALCFQLMVKYQVQLCHESPDYSYAQCEHDVVRYNTGDSPSKAICLAIIEAYND